MKEFDRLPAIPLIANDPYFSVWLPGDLPTDAHTVHWTGADKRVRGWVTVDGKRMRFLGQGAARPADVTGVSVTPTATEFAYQAGNVYLKVIFRSPALPDDPDLLSTPVTIVDLEAVSADGCPHEVAVTLLVSDQICYDGAAAPALFSDSYRMGSLCVTYVGKQRQSLLDHSADHSTIDWGYFYMASACPVSHEPGWTRAVWNACAGAKPQKAFVLLGYDAAAEINYFGTLCKAWYARGGKQFPAVLAEMSAAHDDIVGRCDALDADVVGRARQCGGEAYRLQVCAAWRQTFAAHKLIATPAGEMAFLSKENDSNGCIGTVDVTFPSSALFLAFCPELVNAMCRPVLEFASMPVWPYDFAPHDVGRYPYATGQVYSLKEGLCPGQTVPPYYQYPAGTDVYSANDQMPVEECGNMLILLAAAVRFGASDVLVKKYASLLEKWARYLLEYGEDPGEQLCTDDFSGHLAHNANLAAKAIIGLACYGRLQCALGRRDEGQALLATAKRLAGHWLDKADSPSGSFMTLDGAGWSCKYNLVWDPVLELGLFPEEFYRRETESYLGRLNAYGLPLDPRADYGKSDWQCWCAAMSPDEETRKALLKPVTRYLRESPSRVPFSDWYDTKRGVCVEFVARSVQGGVLMPLLLKMRHESKDV